MPRPDKGRQLKAESHLSNEASRIVLKEHIEKLRIDRQWALPEIPKTSRDVVGKLGFEPHITQNRVS